MITFVGFVKGSGVRLKGERGVGDDEGIGSTELGRHRVITGH